MTPIVTSTNVVTTVAAARRWKRVTGLLGSRAGWRIRAAGTAAPILPAGRRGSGSCREARNRVPGYALLDADGRSLAPRDRAAGRAPPRRHARRHRLRRRGGGDSHGDTPRQPRSE